ncbi:MAG: ATP-binding protein [Anaerolineae bacterium]|nr:ATP-binding protein [Anaerolineae bacterium]
MTSLRVHLTLTYLVVILVGIGLATPLAWLAVERLYLDTQKANLLAQAQLVAASLPLTESLPVEAGEPYSQLANVVPGIHTRLIEAEGAVVIDLPAAPMLAQAAVAPLPALAQNAAGLVSPEELLSRPEIAQALAGQPATAIRRVEVAGGRQVLYAAAPVKAADGRVARLVYLASPLPDTSLSTLPGSVRWQLAGVLVGAVLLATGVGWWLARRISGPLRELGEAATAVATGDLSRTAPEETLITDLRHLARAFNAMTASLRQADQLKAAFIADVSHELRTPLTALKGTIETLQDGAVDDLPARDRFLASLAAETERLIRLVNDLLVLTRADAGTLRLQPQPLALTDLVRRRVEHLTALAAPRQVRLRVVEAGESPAVLAWADADRLAQVLDNLLDNAIRHSSPEGEVTVTVAPEADQLRCTVTDSGPGIPAEHLPFIFERFYRADPARSRSLGNSGLGLAIARALILAHNGRITAHSVEGQGTTVTFWLPAAPICP